MTKFFNFDIDTFSIPCYRRPRAGAGWRGGSRWSGWGWSSWCSTGRAAAAGCWRPCRGLVTLTLGQGTPPVLFKNVQLYFSPVSFMSSRSRTVRSCLNLNMVKEDWKIFSLVSGERWVTTYYYTNITITLTLIVKLKLWSSGKGKGKGWTQEGHLWMVDGGWWYTFPWWCFTLKLVATHPPNV